MKPPGKLLLNWYFCICVMFVKNDVHFIHAVVFPLISTCVNSKTITTINGLFLYRTWVSQFALASSFSTCSGRDRRGISRTGFHGPGILPSTHPSVSKHWREHKALTLISGLASSFLQGPRRANLHKWRLAQSPSCDCGQHQTMNHIVNMCQLTKFEGGLNLLHEVDDDAVIWRESTATAAHAKWNPFFIHQQIPDGRNVAAFVPFLWCQCLCVNSTTVSK